MLKKMDAEGAQTPLGLKEVEYFHYHLQEEIKKKVQIKVKVHTQHGIPTADY